MNAQAGGAGMDPFSKAEDEVRAMAAAPWWHASAPQQRADAVASRMLSTGAEWWLFGAWGRWYRCGLDGHWHPAPPPAGPARQTAQPAVPGGGTPPIPPGMLPSGPDLRSGRVASAGLAGDPPSASAVARVQQALITALSVAPQQFPLQDPSFAPGTPSTLAAAWGSLLWCAGTPVVLGDHPLIELFLPYLTVPKDRLQWMVTPGLSQLSAYYIERLMVGDGIAAGHVVRVMGEVAAALGEDPSFAPGAAALSAITGHTLQYVQNDMGAARYGPGAVVQEWQRRCPPEYALTIVRETAPGDHLRLALYDLAETAAAISEHVPPAPGAPAADARRMAVALAAADLQAVPHVLPAVLPWLDGEAGRVLQEILGTPSHPLRELWPRDGRLPDRLRTSDQHLLRDLLATSYSLALTWCRLAGLNPPIPGFAVPAAAAAELTDPAVGPPSTGDLTPWQIIDAARAHLASQRQAAAVKETALAPPIPPPPAPPAPDAPEAPSEESAPEAGAAEPLPDAFAIPEAPEQSSAPDPVATRVAQPQSQPEPSPGLGGRWPSEPPAGVQPAQPVPPSADPVSPAWPPSTSPSVAPLPATPAQPDDDDVELAAPTRRQYPPVRPPASPEPARPAVPLPPEPIPSSAPTPATPPTAAPAPAPHTPAPAPDPSAATPAQSPFSPAPDLSAAAPDPSPAAPAPAPSPFSHPPLPVPPSGSAPAPPPYAPAPAPSAPDPAPVPLSASVPAPSPFTAPPSAPAPSPVPPLSAAPPPGAAAAPIPGGSAAPVAGGAPAPLVVTSFGVTFLCGVDDVGQMLTEVRRRARWAQGLQEQEVSSASAPALVLLGAPSTGQRRVARMVARALKEAGAGNGRVHGVASREVLERGPDGLRPLLAEFADQVVLLEDLDELLLDSPACGALASALYRARTEGVSHTCLVATCAPERFAALAEAYPQLAADFRQVRLPDLSRPDMRVALLEVLGKERALGLDDAAWEVARRDMTRMRGRGGLTGARLIETYLDRAATRHFGAAEDTISATGPGGLRLAPSDFEGLAEELEPGLREVKDLAACRAELHSMVGLGAVKQAVERMAAEAQVAAARRLAGLPVSDVSRHLGLAGEPGTGKATVARLLAQIYAAIGLLDSGHVVTCTPADLAGPGGVVAAVRAKVTEALGGVLLVEEAGRLGEPGARAVLSELTRAMDERRERLVVICADRPAELRAMLAAEPALSRRLAEVVDFPVPADQELVQQFLNLARAQQYIPDEPLAATLPHLIHRLRANPAFAAGDGVRRLFEETVARQSMRIVRDGRAMSTGELTRLTADDLPT